MERRLDFFADLDRSRHGADRARVPRSLYAPARRTGRLAMVQIRRIGPAHRHDHAAHEVCDAMGGGGEAVDLAPSSDRTELKRRATVFDCLRQSCNPSDGAPWLPVL